MRQTGRQVHKAPTPCLDAPAEGSQGPGSGQASSSDSAGCTLCRLRHHVVPRTRLCGIALKPARQGRGRRGQRPHQRNVLEGGQKRRVVVELFEWNFCDPRSALTLATSHEAVTISEQPFAM